MQMSTTRPQQARQRPCPPQPSPTRRQESRLQNRTNRQICLLVPGRAAASAERERELPDRHADDETRTQLVAREPGPALLAPREAEATNAPNEPLVALLATTERVLAPTARRSRR